MRVRTVIHGEVLIGVVVLVGLGLGCEAPVDPVIGTERAYTIYGQFNPRADTQAVRVYLIEDLLAPERPEPIDARVESEDLHTGDQWVWQDSLVLFDELGRQSYGHVFWAPFRAMFEHSYWLDITRSDGAVSRVEVVVPPESAPVILEPRIVPQDIRLPVLWTRAPRLNGIQVHYAFTFLGFEFSYGLAQEQVAEGTVVEVRLSEDARRIFRLLAEADFDVGPLRLCEIELGVTVSSADWVPPGEVYDPELLVQPGTFSNVENGFGFVGGGYPASVRWTPLEDVLFDVGFGVDTTDACSTETAIQRWYHERTSR